MMAEEFKAEVAKLIEDRIEQNNQSMLASMKFLLDNSVQQLKRASTENAESQLKEMQSHTPSRRRRTKTSINLIPSWLIQ